MIKTKICSDPLELASRWLVNSGIQSSGGGVYAWYDLKEKAYSYVYSEITGYAITTLLYLTDIFNDRNFIKKAEAAASWILNKSVHQSGGVKTRLYNDDERADNAYSFVGKNLFSFDTGMVLYGMINLYKKNGKEEFLEASKRMADFLTDIMQNEDGSLSAVYNAETGEKKETLDKWSNQRGSFHAKISLGLLDLFCVTNEEKYKISAIKLCTYAVSMQEKTGRFITNKGDNTTNMHPHCYSAEGLFYAGVLLKDSQFTKSAARATKWIFDNLSIDGINELYYPQYGKFSDFQRSDVLAQALRLGIIFGADKEQIENLKSKLLQYQLTGEESNQSGGFLYSRGSSHINSWCTMFAMQALDFCNSINSIPSSGKSGLLI